MAALEKVPRRVVVGGWDGSSEALVIVDTLPKRHRFI
jgi:hypothetical protein